MIDRMLALLASALLLAASGCADAPATADPTRVVLPGSRLAFAVKDDNDRHLTVENGKECEHLADVTTYGRHPGRAAAQSTAGGAFAGQLAFRNTPGTLLGAAAGALTGDAIGAMTGTATPYRSIVRNCMASMGHKALD